MEVPPFPDDLEYLWNWFLDLSLGRQPGVMGPARLTWLDYDAWVRRRLKDIDLEDWELDCLLELDSAFIAAQANQKPATPKPPPKQ